jgi:RHS repeat-associated protein
MEKAVTVKVGQNLVTTRYKYLYDGLDIVQELDDAGAVTANYVRSLNIDEPLARVEADGTVRYYHADALGSVTALTDASEAVQTRYKYESFGKTEMTLDDGHGALNPFRYTGRELDETGDYYYRARYYDPAVGRFVSEDPIGLAGGVNFYVYADSVGKPLLIETNRYSYVGNDPIDYIDPLGLIKWRRVGFGALGAAEGVQIMAVGATAITLTAVTTKSPTLTAIVGVEMVPVFWAGWFKTTHGIGEIIEGFEDPKQIGPAKCH